MQSGKTVVAPVAGMAEENKREREKRVGRVVSSAGELKTRT